MPCELAAPSYFPLPPNQERLQLEYAYGQVLQGIIPPSLDPEVLNRPPGLPWIPGQLLRTAIDGSVCLDGRTQVPLGIVSDIMQPIPSHVEMVSLAGDSDSVSESPTSMTWPRLEETECEERTYLEAILEQVLRAALAKDHVSQKAWAGNGKGLRWWTCPGVPLLCPLSGFPICLLPYPPFKLRTDARRSCPYRMVDGKFLAMRLISTGCRDACGRKLQASDISALDGYIRCCKLGNLRPGHAAALEEEAEKATDLVQQARIRQDLDHMVMFAKAELGKLCRIQEYRILQINKMLPARAQAVWKSMRNALLCNIVDTSAAVMLSKRYPLRKRGRHSSSASVSTQAITSSGSSEASRK